MSTIKATTLSNLAGSQTVPVDTVAQGSAKAWVNFNGTGTVAIRRAFNVSSITDLGVGVYRANFTAAMPDSSYAVNLSAGDFPTTVNNLLQSTGNASSNCTLYTYNNSVSIDLPLVYASIFS